MKYIHEIDELEKIKNNLHKLTLQVVNKNIKTILEQIAIDYKIPIEELLEKYYINTNNPIEPLKDKAKPKIDIKIPAPAPAPDPVLIPKIEKSAKADILKCKAKTVRGTQCSNAIMHTNKMDDIKIEYCKKHFTVRKYGDF